MLLPQVRLKSHTFFRSSSQFSGHRCQIPAGRTLSTQPEENKEKMDKGQTPPEKTGDVMSHSFGEGYSTRSDEEGFGGIYSKNQSLGKKEKDEGVHENHPDYDKSQGSEVKEKEKGRNKTEDITSS
ncbi:late embryogenesis abundant protein isoform X2 [Tasmannia lanceolata]|uniref:late embryogenesis abundant protein isoform X2 n=1 Tax=Tasmannia lanceolata TaxID=3420 RepID=UPI004064C263